MPPQCHISSSMCHFILKSVNWRVVFFFTSHTTCQNLNIACQLTCNLYCANFCMSNVKNLQKLAKTLSKVHIGWEYIATMLYTNYCWRVSRTWTLGHIRPQGLTPMYIISMSLPHIVGRGFVTIKYFHCCHILHSLSWRPQTFENTCFEIEFSKLRGYLHNGPWSHPMVM
jgi:hypothetical protein